MLLPDQSVLVMLSFPSASLVYSPPNPQPEYGNICKINAAASNVHKFL